jgi:methionine synthase II (cobalamin-independent)
MGAHVHFVGSIALDSAEDVFNAVSQSVKPFLKRCPDGEVGGRRLWISWQWPVLRATPFLEPASDTAIPGMGLCALRFKSTANAADVHFGELGYAREARTSYQDFLTARRNGLIAETTRFQVSLPTPAAVIGAFVVPADIHKVLPEYERAMLREVERLSSAIPHSDLAIQWDVCIEMIQWDGRAPQIPPYPGLEGALKAAFARLAAAVPSDVELGFHLCYGDMDAKHFVEPLDLAKAVSLANLLMAVSGRTVNWIHMPVPISRDDTDYFAPLQGLQRSRDTELYLGLVHAKDGVAGTVRRMQTARRFVQDFGIATECGIGRSRTPELVRELMRIHASAAESE